MWQGGSKAKTTELRRAWKRAPASAAAVAAAPRSIQQSLLHLWPSLGRARPWAVLNSLVQPMLARASIASPTSRATLPGRTFPPSCSGQPRSKSSFRDHSCARSPNCASREGAAREQAPFDCGLGSDFGAKSSRSYVSPDAVGRDKFRVSATKFPIFDSRLRNNGLLRRAHVWDDCAPFARTRARHNITTTF